MIGLLCSSVSDAKRIHTLLKNSFSRISSRLLSGKVSQSSRAEQESGPKEPGCRQELRDEERGKV